MKSANIWRIVLAVGLTFTFLFSLAFPVAAGDPGKERVGEEKVVIVYDRDKAPTLFYGGEGTRLGPPGKRADYTPISLAERAKKGTPSPEPSDHESFGAELIDTNDVIGARAYQEVHTDLTLESNDNWLYAPTLQCADECPIEIVTAYHKTAGGSMER